MKVHLDTDIGGDIDDLCALALLLAWPGVELTAVTTVADDGGRRAGYARYALALAARGEIPVASGADVSLGCYRHPLGYPDEARYWPEPVTPSPNPPEQALDLLAASIEAGATIVAIGPLTNLSLLERHRPGILERARLCLMGGYVAPVPPGFPAWNHETDFNVQVDALAAEHVMRSSHPLLVPIEVTVQTALRRAFLPQLRRAGPLAQLIARQAAAFAEDENHERRYGAVYQALPRDLINFQHDPLACAVALGWDGAGVETVPLAVELQGTWLRFLTRPDGRPTRVVTRIDRRRFDRLWLDLVTRPTRLAPPLPEGERVGSEGEER
jgi:purine nucleosidase